MLSMKRPSSLAAGVASTRSRLAAVIVSGAVALAWATGAHAQDGGQSTTPPAFSSVPERDRAGFFTLSWSADGPVEVEWTPPAAAGVAGEFVPLYAGRDSATTLSGLPNGDYRFRVRAMGADGWSDEARVSVEHHSLARALGFFAVGAVVFLVLIGSIVRGMRMDARDQSAA